MKKFVTILFLLSFVIALMGTIGCGPKYASKGTLAELEEAKQACESAKMEFKDLEKKIEQLKEEISSKEAKIVNLEKQLETLKGK